MHLSDMLLFVYVHIVCHWMCTLVTALLIVRRLLSDGALARGSISLLWHCRASASAFSNPEHGLQALFCINS